MDPKLPSIHFVIPCAGVGSRSGRQLPKQYADLAGRPMIAHTLKVLLEVKSIQSICLVVSPSDVYIGDILQNHVKDTDGKISVIFKGGNTRAQSVLAGLEHLQIMGAAKEDWALVHDAARCLITDELINDLISSCFKDSVGGLLALPVADTLKQEAGGRVKNTIPRENKWLAQTPQMFRLEMLVKALSSSLSISSESITDESSAIESLGLQPLLIKGRSTNLKITYPEDFEMAEAILKLRS